MQSLLRRGGLTAVVLAATALLAATPVSAADIRDGGGFFSQEAVSSVLTRLNDIESRHQVRTVIETIRTAPQADRVRAMTQGERQQYFRGLINQKAQAAKTPELFILICRDPSHLRLWRSSALAQRGYGETQARDLTAVLMKNFKARTYDEGLKEAAETLGTQVIMLKARGQSAPGAGAVNPKQPASSFPGWLIPVAIIGLGILAFIVLSRIFRMATSPAGSGYGPTGYSGAPGGGPGGYGGGYGPGYGGGGGFFSNILGGIGGAMAGNWLYDSFFRGHSGSAQASDMTTQDTGGYESTTGGESYGGDFGGDQGGFTGGGGGYDNGGGGFSGGGDFGGGDFGGSDNGGDF